MFKCLNLTYGNRFTNVFMRNQIKARNKKLKKKLKKKKGKQANENISILNIK